VTVADGPAATWWRDAEAFMWRITNPHGDGRDYLASDEAIRVFGRGHIERLLAGKGLPMLPAEADDIDTDALAAHNAARAITWGRARRNR
jgi:hypothetical protein